MTFVYNDNKVVVVILFCLANYYGPVAFECLCFFFTAVHEQAKQVRSTQGILLTFD